MTMKDQYASCFKHVRYVVIYLFIFSMIFNLFSVNKLLRCCNGFDLSYPETNTIKESSGVEKHAASRGFLAALVIGGLTQTKDSHIAHHTFVGGEFSGA